MHAYLALGATFVAFTAVDAKPVRVVAPLLIAVLAALLGGLNAGMKDWNSYFHIYDRAPEMRGFLQTYWRFKIEPGWLLVNSLSKELGITYEWMRVIVIGATVFIKMRVLARHAHAMAMGVAFYFAIFYYFDTMILRTGLAGAFVVLSVSRLSEGRWITAWAWMGVAMSFHFTAIMFVPVLLVAPLWNRDFLPIMALLLLPILALLGSRGMASQVLDVFAQLSPGDTHVDAKIESYVGSEYDRPGGILRGSVLLSIALVTIYAIWRRPVMRRIPEARYFFVAFFAAVSYLVLFNDLVIIGDRAFGIGGFAGCVLAAQLPLAFARGTRELYYMGFAGVMLGLMAIASRGYTPFVLTDFSSELDRARFVERVGAR